jgi:hypothetical protein
LPLPAVTEELNPDINANMEQIAQVTHHNWEKLSVQLSDEWNVEEAGTWNRFYVCRTGQGSAGIMKLLSFYYEFAKLNEKEIYTVKSFDLSSVVNLLFN